MGEVFVKYKVVNASSLIYRDKPSLKGATKGYLNNGDIVTIVKGWSKEADGITWLKLKSNAFRFYVSARYLERLIPDYRSLVCKNAEKVYSEVIKQGCKHRAGSKKFSDIATKKMINCSSAVSIVLQLSGMLEEGKIFNHTRSVSNPVKKKDTILKAMTGKKDIKKDSYVLKRVCAEFPYLSKNYKKKGAIYVYDSNLGIYAGDNAIYSCNNAPSQLKDGKYIKNKMTSGYCFTEPILYVILPND